MKQYRLFILFCVLSNCIVTNAQTNIGFTYDNSGNIIERKLLIQNNRPNAPVINPKPHSEEKDSMNVLEFKIYPNPTNDFVIIDGSLPNDCKSAKLYLINNSGQILLKDNYDGSSKSINVQDLKPGVYYLEINYSKKKSSNYKVIISN